MAEQFLNRANIVAMLQQMGGKAVAQGMTTDFFRQVGAFRCCFDRFLNHCFIQVVTADMTTLGIGGQAAGRKDLLCHSLRGSAHEVENGASFCHR